MAGRQNPVLVEAITYFLQHPEMPQKDVAVRFNLKPESFYNALCRARAQGKNFHNLPPSTSTVAPVATRIVPLPAPIPPPPRVLTNKLTQLAQEVVAARLQRMSDPSYVAKETPEEMRTNILLILERFDLVTDVANGKSLKVKKGETTSSVVAALLGEGLEEEHGSEAVATR